MRSQLADFFDEVSDQLSLRSLPGVGCSQRIYAPTLWLSACDQCADARDLVKRVLGKAGAERLAHLRLAGICQVKQSRAAARSGMVSRSQTMTVCSDMTAD